MTARARTNGDRAPVSSPRRASSPGRGRPAAADATQSLQRTAGNAATSALLRAGTSPVHAIGAGGRALESPIRREMEERFAEDFGDVRIHTGDRAADSAAALAARAYTVGRDIVFAPDAFAPATRDGKHLLAHELAHVVQQARGGPAPTLDAGSSLEHDAGRAASDVSAGGEAVSVAGASGVGVARSEDTDLPWWKRQLNPLYQQALEKLPPSAAAHLKALNDGARQVVQSQGIKDERIDTAVRLVQPAIDPAKAMLDTLPQRATGAPQDVAPTVWLGQVPLDTRLQQRADQKQAQAVATSEDPLALAPPPPRPGAASRSDLPAGNLLAAEPDPTPFEAQLRSRKTFTHTFTPPVDIDASKAVWLGRDRPPTVDQLNHTLLKPADNLPPSTVVGVPGRQIGITISGDDVMPIRDAKTGEVKGYRYRQGDTLYEWDRDGQFRSLTGDEKPLEEPAVDPIDVAMFVADVGPLVAKGLGAAGKSLARKAATGGARGLAEAGTEGALKVGGKEAARTGATAVRGPTINRFGEEEVQELVGFWRSRLEATTDAALKKRYQRAIDVLEKRGRVRDWRQSEDDVRHLYSLIGGQGETGYVNGRQLKNAVGVKGAVKPDVLPPNALGEVKNWEMTHIQSVRTANEMMDKLASQIEQRALHGPFNIKAQTVILDLRGQVLTERDLQLIGEAFADRTGLPIENIQMIVWAP